MRWKILSGAEGKSEEIPAQNKPLVPIIITAVILLAILITTVIIWARTPTPMRAAGAPEEQLLNYMAGRNFVTHGFLSRGFITDYSLDPVPEAPPVYYTHFPPGPSIVIGVLSYMGIDNLPEVRLVMNFIFVAGLAVVALFFWRHLTPWHGIGALSFLGINNRAVLINSDHVTYAYWFGLTFLAFWALTLRSKTDRFLWLGLAAILLITFVNYTQVVVTMVALFGLWLIRLRNLTLKRMLMAVSVTAGGLVLHILQNIVVLGWDTAVRDVLYTMGNRLVGVPSRGAILSFAQENDLVLWGVSELAPVGSRFNWIFAEFGYFIVPVLISLVGLGLLAYFRRSKTAIFSLKLVGVFTLANISWHLIFQAHGQAAPLPITVALPMAMTGGFFMGELVNLLPQQFKTLRTLEVKKWHMKLTIPNAMLILAGLVTLWQGATLGLVGLDRENTLYPTAPVRELEIVRPFHGEGFWTNVTPHLVGYYTESWVVGQMPLAAVMDGDASKAFVTTLSRLSPTKEEASKPHYFFFSKHNVVLNIDDRGERLEQYRHYFEENFPILARSPYGSMVLDLSWGPFGTSHLLTGRHSDIPDIHAKVPITAEQVKVSSANSPSEGGGNLVAEGTDGYWLRSPGELRPAWVQVDFGSPQAVSAVRILPREGYADQSWHGNSSLLESSSDGENWKPLAILGLANDSVPDDWAWFPVHGTRAYQYYRISIRDPDFRSLSKLEFCTVKTP